MSWLDDRLARTRRGRGFCSARSAITRVYSLQAASSLRRKRVILTVPLEVSQLSEHTTRKL